jgi:hypothetical protein
MSLKMAVAMAAYLPILIMMIGFGRRTSKKLFWEILRQGTAWFLGDTASLPKWIVYGALLPPRPFSVGL